MNNCKIIDALRCIGEAGSVLFRSLMLLIFSVAFASSSVTGDETLNQNLEFRWKFVKLGAMDFEIGPVFFSEAAANAGEFGQPLFANAEEVMNSNSSDVAPVHLAVTGSTNGPLKWFKSYQARAELTVKGQLRTFALAGEDNGVDGKRALVFALGLPPVVESFIDSSAPEPLEVQNAWKLDTVDPLTVFEWVIFSAVHGQSCAKKFWIYDGKRRYGAQTTDLVGKDGFLVGSNEVLAFEQNSLMRCRLTLLGSNSKGHPSDEVINEGDQVSGVGAGLKGKNSRLDVPGFGSKVTGTAKVGWGSLWPFGTSDRHIDFELRVCAGERVIVERVVMGAPIGRVIGTTKARC